MDEEDVRLAVSVIEAAKLLGISRGTAYARAKDGRLPTIRLGKRVLVSTIALDKMLLAKETPDGDASDLTKTDEFKGAIKCLLHYTEQMEEQIKFLRRPVRWLAKAIEEGRGSTQKGTNESVACRPSRRILRRMLSQLRRPLPTP